VTYSLVARDPESGELGVAVQSHWFSVGSIVSWARAGVGAVATQSVADPGYGKRLLDHLEGGETSGGALGEALAADDSERFRQVAVVDAGGAVAAHTGEGCIPYAGHVEGEGFSAQANMMTSPDVWPAMASAFEASVGPLAHRLMAALEAAERAGGDVRGRQSAALVVVPAEGQGWERVTDVRVDDSPDPLGELHRLLALGDAYAIADRADELAGKGDHEEAARLYVAAAEASPESEELSFWAGLGIAASGDLKAGAERVAAVIGADPRWRELLARLDPEIAPAAPDVRRELGVGT
jgi:uncharacterized Ntn-hydrolase superfamily protein